MGLSPGEGGDPDWRNKVKKGLGIDLDRNSSLTSQGAQSALSAPDFSSYLPGLSNESIIKISQEGARRASEQQQFYGQFGYIQVLPERERISSNEAVSAIAWSVWDLYTTPSNYNMLGGGQVSDRTINFGYNNRFRGKVDDQGYLHTNTIEFQGDPDRPDMQYAGPIPWKSIGSGFLRCFEGLPWGNSVAHSFAKHVGKDLKFLLGRLKNEPHIPAAFSFFDEAAADFATLSTVLENRTAIKSWLATVGEGRSQAFSSSFSFPVGIVINRGSTVAQPASTIRITVVKNSALPNGFFIGTVRGQ